MRYFWVGLVLFPALITAITAASADFNVPDSTPGVIDFIGFDTDVSGNTATHVASVEASRSAVIGQTFSVDIVVDEIDVANEIFAFQTEVLYDPAILRIVGSNYDLLITSAPGSVSPIIFQNALPDSDGVFYLAFSENSAAHEHGEGVLVRLQFQCVGVGITPLTMADSTNGEPYPFVVEWSTSNPIPITNNQPGNISCTPDFSVGGSVALTVNAASNDGPASVWYIAPSLALAALTAFVGRILMNRRKRDTNID